MLSLALPLLLAAVAAAPPAQAEDRAPAMAFAEAEAESRVGIFDLQTARFYLPMDPADAAGHPATPPYAAINRPPRARNDAAVATEGTARRVRVLRNDRDPEGQPLSVTALGTPDMGGRVRTINDGTQVRYIPAVGFTGVEHFTYTVSDGVNSVNATVTITVEPAGGDIDCTPVQAEIQGSGGCRLSLTAPANCANVPATYTAIEIDWTTHTTFCESPKHIYIVGHPAAESPVWDISINETNGEFRAIGSNGSGYAMTRNIGGYLYIVKADLDAILAQLPSTNGQYHFAVRGFYAIDNGGSISESRTLVFER